MAELNDSPCSSDHDEYSDPLEIAASAGARLRTPENAGISRQRKVQMSHERQRYFTYQISILARFVLFEYQHVIIYLVIIVIKGSQ